ncbi:hypothetical protein D3C72_2031790 [compost metagenome]
MATYESNLTEHAYRGFFHGINAKAPAAGDALEVLINNLAGMAYQYAVTLDQATRHADSDELEGIARRITSNLKDKMRAAIAQQSQRKEA